MVSELLCLCVPAGCEHSALHQRESVGSVCADPDGESAAQSLPTGPRLHRGETAHGGRERETGHALKTSKTSVDGFI